MFDLSNTDLTIPLAIVAGCALVVLLTSRLTRPRNAPISVPGAKVVPAHTSDFAGGATAAQLADWHNQHGWTVQRWIQNHELALDEVADKGRQVTDISREIIEEREGLAPVLQDAIRTHPSPPMRAQLSGLIVASQATLTALSRQDFAGAERQHLTYLEYRDTWLDRLRQFSATDAQSRQIGSLAQQRQPPGWA